MTLSIAFEILVSLLLIITIGYCFRLDRRLKALRSGQDGVRDSIAQLVQATAQAGHSVSVLTETGNRITSELEAQIIEAKAVSGEIMQKQSRTPVSNLATRQKPNDPARSLLMDRLKRAG